MKKLLFLLAILVTGHTVRSQSDSAILANFAATFKTAESKYQSDYEAKDYKHAAVALDDMQAAISKFKLSDSAMAEYRTQIPGWKSNIYYNQACVHALLGNKQQAMRDFEQAINYGYSEYDHANTDTDLDPIRREKKFKTLMQRIMLQSKLGLLKRAGSYKQENTSAYPSFFYQSAQNSNLQQVRAYFNLDSIAGNGNETSKIINLMLFVTNAISYDGTNWALCEFDAIDFYNYHRATGKGINCRHKAMTLNELYLAMGFKSRYVTCMPSDSKDQDCHVIVSVYSPALKKWLWMDPSHGAYVTDENGQLLSIREVRERLREDLPLQLNKESRVTKEWYLYSYMAKNLYWIQCTNQSRFNTESRYRGYDTDLKYISLIPGDYDTSNPYLKNNTITFDPDYFWKQPE